jgi:glyoxylase-like metal-dependent hydrolase (beta-lactamase superfamily II)
MKIFPLLEGNFTVDVSKKFIPFTEEDALPKRNRGSLLVAIQPFLIITNRDIILLDAGLGFVNKNGEFQLYENLKKNGIHPNSVTKIILSHLHKDHAGGLINPFTGQLSFEQADLFVQKNELEYAIEKGAPSYETENLENLRNYENLRLLDNNCGIIDGYIHYEVTGAHSKFHQAIRIEEDDETIFFGADDAPQLGQMKKNVIAKYDFNGKKAAVLRNEWWSKGREENWSFLFYHDAKHAVYHAN